MASGLRFITGIRYYKRMLETLNNITYMYDDKWSPDNSNKATFPVCFFHVKSYHETMNSEVSQKQMLFYNSDVDATRSDPKVDSGLLNVVADNIVIKPKVYKLDVIIPYHNITLLDQSFVYNTYTMNYINTVLTGKESKLGEAMMRSYGAISAPFTNFVQGIIRTLIGQTGIIDWGSTPEDWLRNTVQQPDYNKYSLEMMWKLRHIVKMKMWNSWEYKYVAIVDIDITKEGTEDGVYEATLTVQEMPIISMYSKDSTKGEKYTYKNPLLRAQGKKVIEVLDAVGGKGVGV
jgi:hypothetical protein